MEHRTALEEHGDVVFQSQTKVGHRRVLRQERVFQQEIRHDDVCPLLRLLPVFFGNNLCMYVRGDKKLETSYLDGVAKLSFVLTAVCDFDHTIVEDPEIDEYVWPATLSSLFFVTICTCLAVRKQNGWCATSGACRSSCHGGTK